MGDRVRSRLVIHLRARITFLAFSVLCAPLVTASAQRAPSKNALEPEPLAAPIGTPHVSAAVADTVWFADWGFGTKPCDASGWTAADLRILSDGAIHWHMESVFGGQGGISGQAATIGYHDQPCCVSPNGYFNDWYEAIRLTYTGAATLSFDYLLDSEAGFDFMQVEADSQCASFDRVDYGIDPSAGAANFRTLLLSRDGLVNGSIAAQALPDFGPGTHCVFIAFFSDGAFSPCDGDQPNTLGEALVVDDLSITDAGGTRSEDFEDGTLDIGTFVNLQDSEPFGLWARLHPHATDNAVCGEVRDCAWIFSDPTRISTNPDLDFGPGGAVVRNWLDNVIVSPWVALPPAGLGTAGTVLDFRVFNGSSFVMSRIVHSWWARTRRSSGGVECITPWQSLRWQSMSTFMWQNTIRDLTPAVPATATEIQVRYRVSDWQYIASAAPPLPADPGPGPYLDRVRIGRRILHGPLFSEDIGEHGQAQDNFPSVLASTVPVQDFTPSTDAYGVSDFSPPYRHLGAILGQWYSKTRDSLFVWVRDERGAGGITGVGFHGAIVSGPHAGKAPPPWVVGADGFFAVPATVVPSATDAWFADLDDRYFRGGDVLLYFWSATDAAGGYSSQPDGMTAPPASVAQAETDTGGLYEVSFLPTIAWDPGFLARIQADPAGKLDPTAEELAGSHPQSCILYERILFTPRRSGEWNRSAFMYALDHLGYAGAYDRYDQLGAPVANSQVMSRVSLAVAGNYALIIVDAPSSGYLAVPDGVVGSGAEGRLDQSQWYQDWLAGASTSPAGRATLWLVGNDMVTNGNFPGHVVVEEAATTLVTSNVQLGLHPQVRGQTSFTWADGTASDFSSGAFGLATGICGRAPAFDALGTSGTGVVTHRYATTAGVGDGAVVLNANAAAAWNTVVMSFNWNWLGSAGDAPTSQVLQLADTIVRAALADSCEHDPNPTAVPDIPPEIDGFPRQTALLPNVPNPFNPVTTIHFDLGRDGMVELRIHDAAGRVVRTLLRGERERRHHELVWDGLDDVGRRVPSGVYFTRLHTADGDWTRKLVVLR